MKMVKRKLISVMCIFSMLYTMTPIYAEENFTGIAFDDCVTNDSSDYVDVVGTSNARVVEDGNKNKSYYVDCTYIDSEINIMLPEHTRSKKYTLLFDMRVVGECAGATIDFITDKENVFEGFVIAENGDMSNADDAKVIANVKSSKMKTIGFSVNNELRLYSCYGNNKRVINKRNYSADLSYIEKILIKVNAPGKESKVYLDNIRVYEGNEYSTKKISTIYNPLSAQYEETDESKLGDKVFYYNDLNSKSSLSLSYLPMGNTLEYVEEGEGDNKNGFMRFTKINSQGIYTYQSVGKVGKHIIVEADVRHGRKSPCYLTFILIDSESSSSRIIMGPFSVYDSSIKGGGVSSSLNKNKWNKISLSMDYTKHTFDVYLNGVKVIKDKAISAGMETLSELRFSVASGSELGVIDVDNIAIYSGKEPRSVNGAGISNESRFGENDTATAYLRGKTAVQTYSNTMYANNQKQYFENKCINIGDESLLPKDVFEKLFNKSVSVSGNSVTVSDGVKFAVGEKTINVNGRVTGIQEAPKIVDGMLYIPAVAYGKNAVEDGQFFNDNHGMLIVGKSVTADDNRKKLANLFLFFDRKSTDELKAQLSENTNNLTAHPRLMMTPDSVVSLRNEVKNDPYKKKWFESVKKYADAYLDTEPAVYKVTNDRLLDLSNSTLSKIETLGFVYLMTQDKKYGNRTVQELKALANFPDWGQQYSFLETATFSSAFALGFDWAYDCMDSETAQELANKAQELGLKVANQTYTASAGYNDFWWNTETNWGIICNGGISNLAMATAEYNTDECIRIFKDALRSIEFTWYRFAPDGSWHEGPGYWSYMFTHLSRFMSSYLTAMGEPFAANYRGLDKYGYFQCYFMGPDGLPNNFHDADLIDIQSEGQFILAKIFGDNELMRYRREQIEKNNLTPCAEDIIWYDASLSNDKSPVKLSNEKYFRETEFVSVRENWDNNDSAWLSYHGGEMFNAHDHIDAGTYVFNLGGVRWAVDLGKEPLRYVQTNNPATSAGYTIFDFYRARAEGHNSVVINPGKEFEMNVNTSNKVEEPETSENGTIGKLDLTQAYSANTSSYLRGYKLSDSRRTFTLRDEIKLNSKSDVYWFMHTYGTIRIIDDNNAVIYQDGKALKVQVACNKEGGKLSVMDTVSLPSSPKFNMSLNEGASKLCYFINTSDNLDITVKMSLVGEVGSNSGVDVTPISEWDADKLSKGEGYSYSAARLSGLYLDGNLINGFSKDKYLYSVTKTKSGYVPKVTALSDDGDVTVETFKGLNDKDMTLITVHGKDGKDTYYVAVFEEYSNLSIDVYDKYELKPVAASSEEIYPESDTYCTIDKAVDGDLSTRWASNGTKEWAIFDLGESKEIDAFALAFWMGNQRSFDFDLLISDDNLNYTKIMSTVSDGKTESPVVFIPEQKVKGRYIKFAGHGNSANNYNHVIEIMALKGKE